MGDPNPAVLDRKFRFALNFAIDREQLASKAYQGAAMPATNIIPPAYKGYQWKPPTPDAYAYDPDKAKQLLDAAGYKVGSDGWRTMPDGSPIGKLRLAARVGLRGDLAGDDAVLPRVAGRRADRLRGRRTWRAAS